MVSERNVSKKTNKIIFSELKKIVINATRLVQSTKIKVLIYKSVGL